MTTTGLDFALSEWGRGGHITSRVTEILGCSSTELDRWDDDGRLPAWGWVRISLPRTSKKVEARVWALPDLLVAALLLDDWRAADKTAGKRPVTGRPVRPVLEASLPRVPGLPSSRNLGMPLEDAVKAVADAVRGRGVPPTTRQVWTLLDRFRDRRGRFPSPRTVASAYKKLSAPPALRDAARVKADLGLTLGEVGVSGVRVEVRTDGEVTWSGKLKPPAAPGTDLPVTVVPLQGRLASVLDGASSYVVVDRGVVDAVAAAVKEATSRLTDVVGRHTRQILKALLEAGVGPVAAKATVKLAFGRLPPVEPTVPAWRHEREVQAFAATVYRTHVVPNLGKRIREACGFVAFPEIYTTARSLGRRHVVFVGPTNSGKTHRAMTMAVEAASAVVLSPLRLLALEHMETLRARGVAAGLLTGEERDVPEGTTHLAQTIETMDPGRVVEVAVVDEGQMLGDPGRGWAWTRALIGAPARVVVTTGTPEIVEHVVRLAALCGEPCEVVELERLGPLSAMACPISFLAVRPGDAVVAFSRRDVLRWRDRLQAAGLEAAAIYGGLGPEVRRSEAARFRSGEAQVVVATDAIGMGLNLPVKRVILTDVTKFDGKAMRRLTFREARQILGRAGRHGLADAGLAGATSSDALDFVTHVLASEPQPMKLAKFPVRPDPGIVTLAASALGIDSLHRVLAYLRDHMTAGSRHFRTGDMDELVERAAAFDRTVLPLGDRYAYATCPCHEDHLHLVVGWARRHASGGTNRHPSVDTGARLQDLETSAKLLAAYAWLCMRFPAAYPDGEAAGAHRAEIDAAIVRILRSSTPLWEDRRSRRHWRDWDDEEDDLRRDHDEDDDYEDDDHRYRHPVPVAATKPASDRVVVGDKASRKREKRRRQRARKKERLLAEAATEARVVASGDLHAADDVSGKEIAWASA